MYTATVQISITTFNPINYANNALIAAILDAPTNTSPKGSGGSNVFSGTGEEITINTPKGYTGAVQLTFQLFSPDYLLAGIAVTSATPARQGAVSSAGRQQLRTVSINRDPTGSQMIVTDSCVADATYNYVILVQAVTGPNAGQIGLIDPGIDDEPGE